MQNNLRELLALLAFMADTSIDTIERRIKVGCVVLLSLWAGLVEWPHMSTAHWNTDF